MKRAVLLPLSVILFAACGDSPIEPESTEALSPIQASLSVTAAAAPALDFSGDFGRIASDVLPNFNDAQAAQQFGNYLNALSAALASGDKAEATRVLELARSIVITPDAVNDGDRGYIELVLRDVAAALQP